MNSILLFKEDFFGTGNRVCLTDRRHKHILEILKPSVGGELCVGLANGKLGKGRILSLSDTFIEMDVALDIDPPEPLPLTLVLAMPRPIVLKRILAHVAALGVKRIFLIHTDRVEKSYWKSPVLEEESISESLVLGLEQARDTILPEVMLRKRFKPFVEDELPELAKGTRAYVAHPDGQTGCPCCSDGPITLVIGPEGGLLPYEVLKLKSVGCVPVNLGERILRVETAVIACVARFMKLST